MKPSPRRGPESSSPMVTALNVMPMTLLARSRRATKAAAKAINEGMPMKNAADWSRSAVCSRR